MHDSNGITNEWDKYFPNWPTKIWRRTGTPKRSCVRWIYHDFSWAERIRHPQSTFTNCETICRSICNICPKGRIPSLFLTKCEGDFDKPIEVDGQFIVIHNVDNALNARGDAGATLLFRRVPVDIYSVHSLDIAPDALGELLRSKFGAAAIDDIARTDPLVLEELLENILTRVPMKEFAINDDNRRQRLLGALRELSAELNPQADCDTRDVQPVARKRSDCATNGDNNGSSNECVSPSAVLRELKPEVARLMDAHDEDTIQAVVEIVAGAPADALTKLGVELPEIIAHRQLWRARRNEYMEFKKHLECDDWSEPEWHRFLKAKEWIFGYGLRYHFLSPRNSKPHLGGQDLSGGGANEGDFLMITQGDLRFTVLVEIKTPSLPLAGPRLYRNRTYRIGSHVSNGVVQLLQQATLLEEAAKRPENVSTLERDETTFTRKPHGILVIGHLSSLEGNRDRIHTFESFRRSLHEPQIITFDELFARAGHILKIAESEQKSISMEIV